jgi:hypothetical protein
VSKGNGEGIDTSLEGDGQVELGIYIENNKIMMAFQRPMTWIGFDPSNAVAVGKELIDSAVKLGADVRIITPPRQVTVEHRGRMIQRTINIFNSMSEKGRPIHFIAQQVVDSLLAEIE